MAADVISSPCPMTAPISSTSGVSTTSSRPTSGSSSATSSRTTCTLRRGTRTVPTCSRRPAWDAEPAPSSTQSRVASTSRSRELVLVHPLLLPTHRDLPRARPQRADLVHPGREDVDVHRRQDPGSGLPAGWTVDLGLHGRVPGGHAVASQDFDWVEGTHSLSFGGSWTRPHPNGDGTFQANGNMGFNGIITSGTSNTNGGLNMADFVLGYPNSYRAAGARSTTRGNTRPVSMSRTCGG